MTKRPAPERLEPVADAVEAVRALLLTAYSFRQELAAALGVAVSDTFALSHLAMANSLTAGELAQRAGLAPSSVTAMLDRLERAGLARRTVLPEDRRSQQITLTDRGRQVLAISSQWVEAGFASIPAAELAGIARQLRTIAGALNREADTFTGAVGSGSINGRLGS